MEGSLSKEMPVPVVFVASNTVFVTSSLVLAAAVLLASVESPGAVLTVPVAVADARILAEYLADAGMEIARYRVIAASVFVDVVAAESLLSKKHKMYRSSHDQ